MLISICCLLCIMRAFFIYFITNQHHWILQNLKTSKISWLSQAGAWPENNLNSLGLTCSWLFLGGIISLFYKSTLHSLKLNKQQSERTKIEWERNRKSKREGERKERNIKLPRRKSQSKVKVQFSRSAVFNSLWHHESQHARPPCPSPTPGVHSNSRPSSRRCHPAISSSVVPFSSCPQSLPASQSFPMSQLFTWGGQSTRVSALGAFLPKNTQDWSPLEWTGWISLQSKGLSRVFSNTTLQKHQFFGAQLSSQSNSHIHTWPQEKP